MASITRVHAEELVTQVFKEYIAKLKKAKKYKKKLKPEVLGLFDGVSEFEDFITSRDLQMRVYDRLSTAGLKELLCGCEKLAQYYELESYEKLKKTEITEDSKYFKITSPFSHYSAGGSYTFNIEKNTEPEKEFYEYFTYNWYVYKLNNSSGVYEEYIRSHTENKELFDVNSKDRSVLFEEEGTYKINASVYKVTGLMPVPKLLEVQEQVIQVVNDHVTVFRRKMYEIACQRLDANRAELDAMQASYESYFQKSQYLQRRDTQFEQLRTAYDKDKELKRKDDDMIPIMGDAFTKYNVDPTYQPFIDEYTNARNIRSDIAISRYLLRKAYPELDSVSDGRITYKTNNSQILDRMVKNFDRARKAQDEVRQKIDSGDMPLFKLEPIIEAAMAFYGITESSTTEFAKAVLEWLKSARFWDGVIKIGSTVISLATAAACFIPGVGVGAIIALGAIGAGAGMVGAIYEFEMAEDLDDAAWSQQSGSNQLIADADAAKKEYIWGIVNLCLACVDLFLSGKEVVRVGRVMSKFSSVADGATFLNKIGDAKDAMLLTSRLEKVQDGTKLLTKLETASDDTVSIVSKLIVAAPENRITATIIAMNKFDNVEDTVLILSKLNNKNEAIDFLNFLDDSQIQKLYGSPMDKAVNRVPFYDAYKQFKNGKIPGKSIQRVSSYIDVDIPKEVSIKCKPNSVHKKTGVKFNQQGFPVFDTDFSVKIDEIFYKSTDDVQFKIANEILYEATQKDKKLITTLKLSPDDITLLSNGMKPENYIWHHNQNSGIFELVDKETHRAVGHTAGRAIWGGGNDFRK